MALESWKYHHSTQNQRLLSQIYFEKIALPALSSFYHYYSHNRLNKNEIRAKQKGQPFSYTLKRFLRVFLWSLDYGSTRDRNKIVTINGNF